MDWFMDTGIRVIAIIVVAIIIFFTRIKIYHTHS